VTQEAKFDEWVIFRAVYKPYKKHQRILRTISTTQNAFKPLLMVLGRDVSSLILYDTWNGPDCETEQVFIHITEALFRPSWSREFITEHKRKKVEKFRMNGKRGGTGYAQQPQ
jgi:hypothetical protein